MQMFKFLSALLVALALAAPASAATVTLNWTAPAPVAPNPTDITAIQIWDFATVAGLPPVNQQIGSVGPTLTTFTTAALAPGTHQFTAVAVYGEGSATPSNAVSEIIVTVLAPVTNLTGTVGP